MNNLYLIHHGIKNQHWGERNGPPYPLQKDKVLKNTLHNVHFRLPKMPMSEIILAKELNSRLKEVSLPYKITKNEVFEMFDNNLDDDEKESALVIKPYKDYVFKAINFGHNNYKIFDWHPIAKSFIYNVNRPDEAALIEMFGNNYKEELDEYRKSLKPYQKDEPDNF